MESFDDIAFDVLQNYIENGVRGTLSAEMIEYIEVLELVRSLSGKFKSKNSIINLLTGEPYNLSSFVANKRYVHSMNLFNTNNSIKKQAWRNIYADELDKLASFTIEAMTCLDDLKIVRGFKKDAAELRDLFNDNDIEIPDSVLDRPNKVYTIDPSLIGLKTGNMKILGNIIDDLDYDAFTTKRLKEDVLATPFNIEDKIDEQYKEIKSQLE